MVHIYTTTVPLFEDVFSLLTGYVISSKRKLHWSTLTFFDYSPRTEESLVQSQVGEVLMFLEVLIQSPDDWRDGSVAEPECSSCEHIGG